MSNRLLVALAMALMLALSIAFFAEAAQKNRIIEASGVLEDEKVAVSVPASLALIGADATKQGKPSPARAPGLARGQLKPAGTVASLKVIPGDYVKTGDIICLIDKRVAQQNLEKAQAQYDVIVATIDRLQGTRSDLSENSSKLSDTEADLKAKRAEAQREFAAKYAEGQTKIEQLKDKLAMVKDGLNKAQAGLETVQAAEANARQSLAAAKQLPDSDPTKAQQVAQANAMLEGLLQKQGELEQTVLQLAATKAQLEKGLTGATKGLASGKAQFDSGLNKIDDALAQISEGRDKINDGASKISRKMKALMKRRDQAEVGVRIARQLLDATAVKAIHTGRIKDLRVNERSVIYPGQKLASIVSEDKLKLNIYVPLRDASEITEGDPVEVAVDADPGRTFDGKVVGVDGKAMFAPSNMATRELELTRVIRVVVEVKNEESILKAGMPADVRIH